MQNMLGPVIIAYVVGLFILYLIIHAAVASATRPMLNELRKLNAKQGSNDATISENAPPKSLFDLV